LPVCYTVVSSSVSAILEIINSESYLLTMKATLDTAIAHMLKVHELSGHFGIDELGIYCLSLSYSVFVFISPGEGRYSCPCLLRYAAQVSVYLFFQGANLYVSSSLF
jgi:hypothetical protein